MRSWSRQRKKILTGWFRNWWRRSSACARDRWQAKWKKMMSEVNPTGIDSVRIDHLGIAVANLDAARKLYESLGLKVAHEETVEHEQVRVAMIPMGGGRIELLEPTAED